MSDAIGRITVPSVALSTGGSRISGTQTFPLTTQYPFGFSVNRPVIVHRFGSLDAKQRYFAGVGPRKFQFKRPNLNWTESNQLKAFWESMQGPDSDHRCRMDQLSKQLAGLDSGNRDGKYSTRDSGTGRGQLRKLTGNTATGFQWDLPLYLDKTSVSIIEEPSWLYQTDSPAIGNADYQHEAALVIAAANYTNASYLVAGFTVDVNGNESPDGDNPVREDWVYGAPGAYAAALTYGVAF